MSAEDLFATIDWEGGLWELINGYGMGLEKAQEIYGAEFPAQIVNAWFQLEAAHAHERTILEWLDQELTVETESRDNVEE